MARGLRSVECGNVRCVDVRRKYEALWCEMRDCEFNHGTFSKENNYFILSVNTNFLII